MWSYIESRQRNCRQSSGLWVEQSYWIFRCCPSMENRWRFISSTRMVKRCHAWRSQTKWNPHWLFSKSTSLSPIQTLTCGFREELGNTYPTASGVTGKGSHTARPQLKAKLLSSKHCALVYPVKLWICQPVILWLGYGLRVFINKSYASRLPLARVARITQQ